MIIELNTTRAEWTGGQNRAITLASNQTNAPVENGRGSTSRPWNMRAPLQIMPQAMNNSAGGNVVGPAADSVRTADPERDREPADQIGRAPTSQAHGRSDPGSRAYSRNNPRRPVMQVETTNSVGISSGILPHKTRSPIPSSRGIDTTQSLFLRGFPREPAFSRENALQNNGRFHKIATKKGPIRRPFRHFVKYVALSASRTGTNGGLWRGRISCARPRADRG